MGRETLEPHELVEVEDFERTRRRALSTRVAVTAALLAVLASISALEAEHAAAEAILAKNDAVLWQSRASDEWAYRQAKSIKLHLQELTPGSAADAEGQRTEIAASEGRARTAEQERDKANREAADHFARHHRFAVATSLLQIAIVLETVAAVLDRMIMWYAGLAVGVVGVVALANGFLGYL